MREAAPEAQGEWALQPSDEDPLRSPNPSTRHALSQLAPTSTMSLRDESSPSLPPKR